MKMHTALNLAAVINSKRKKNRNSRWCWIAEPLLFRLMFYSGNEILTTCFNYINYNFAHFSYQISTLIVFKIQFTYHLLDRIFDCWTPVENFKTYQKSIKNRSDCVNVHCTISYSYVLAWNKYGIKVISNIILFWSLAP